MSKFGLIGFPISHSLSPMLFEAAFEGRYPYSLLEFEDFEMAWKEFGHKDFKAVNVTSPFKAEACRRADILSRECLLTGAANILVKTPGGIAAFNSDCLAVKNIISRLPGCRTAAVIGTGGAGKAALLAASECGLRTESFRHDEISDGVSADLVIYTLPRFVPGADKLECGSLLEANYKDPCLSGHPGYISGLQWLYEQAVCGYPLMTGEEIDGEKIWDLILKKIPLRVGPSLEPVLK